MWFYVLLLALVLYDASRLARLGVEVTLLTHEQLVGGRDERGRGR